MRNALASTGLALGLALGCAAPSAPPRPAAAVPETSFDGLQRIDSPRFQAVWRKPDVDTARYRRLALLPPEIRYRKQPKAATQRSTDDNFPLTDKQMQRLGDALMEALREELVEKGGLELTDQLGPDVLVLRAMLLDLVVHVPTEPTANRGGVWAESIGDVTLVVELFDGQTKEILARVADRREVETPGGMMRRVDLGASADVRRLFRAWAVRVREGLEAARARG